MFEGLFQPLHLLILAALGVGVVVVVVVIIKAITGNNRPMIQSSTAATLLKKCNRCGNVSRAAEQSCPNCGVAI